MIFPIVMVTMDNEEHKSKMASIFHEYYYLMLHIAMGILKNRALAEDAVSASIEKIIKNISKIGDVSCYKTKTYIVIIIKNTSIDILRKASRNDSPLNEFTDLPDIADGDSLILENYVSMEGYDNLVAIIKSLPPSLKDATMLSLIHDYNHKEIAEMLGVSYDVVKVRLSRAKKIMKDVLGGERHNG